MVHFQPVSLVIFLSIAALGVGLGSDVFSPLLSALISAILMFKMVLRSNLCDATSMFCPVIYQYGLTGLVLCIFFFSAG